MLNFMMNNEEVENKYVCEECGFVAKTKAGLVSHQRIHRREKEVTEVPESLEAAFGEWTPKQAAFYLKWLELGNKTEAAVQVYNCKTRASAAALATETFQNLNINNPVQRYCEANGLDLRYAMTKLKEGMEATQATNAVVLVQQDGKMESAEIQGLIEFPDYEERREWWDRFMKLMGWSVEDVQQFNQQNVSGNVTYVIEAPKPNEENDNEATRKSS